MRGNPYPTGMVPTVRKFCYDDRCPPRAPPPHKRREMPRCAQLGATTRGLVPTDCLLELISRIHSFPEFKAAVHRGLSRI